MQRGTPAPWLHSFVRALFLFVLNVFYGTIAVENPENVPLSGKPWDYLGEGIDNTELFEEILQALEAGDTVGIFPEGRSCYHPNVYPLRTVARLVSDISTRHRHDPDFEVYVQPSSFTYTQRQYFRTDVLVSFHPPLVFTPKTHPELIQPLDFDHIKNLTGRIGKEVFSRTINSTSWDLIRTAKIAAKIYAPLGTKMALGDCIRLVRSFLELFKAHQEQRRENAQNYHSIRQLHTDLKTYQDQLVFYGITDDRVRRPLHRQDIIKRLLVRLLGSNFLSMSASPVLLLWLPVFATTFAAVHRMKKTGPIYDTWDMIAHYKLLYGLASGLAVWFLGVVATWPMVMVTFFLIPALMWVSMRWLEDSIASYRAFVSLFHMLRVDKSTLKSLSEARGDLRGRLVEAAVQLICLPDDPEVSLASSGEVVQRGRTLGVWSCWAQYFSIRCRRKRDWDETLDVYDKVDYPASDDAVDE